METILIVDDDPHAAALLGRVLRQAGYRVVSAATGEEGIEKTLRLLPDLIFMDFLLPGIDGYETVRRLRRYPATARIPILVLSSVARECLSPARLLDAAVEHLSKTLPLWVLLDRVAKTLHPPGV